MTVNSKELLAPMIKISNAAYKYVDRRKSEIDNIGLLLILFRKRDYDGKIKKLINHKATDKAEDKKDKIISRYIKDSRSDGKWIYLASSHGDCAEDHKAYQGKLYYDKNAPDDIVRYCKSRGMRSIQWVMDKPVWFITRPNCRHFFQSLDISEIKKDSIKKLNKRNKES